MYIVVYELLDTTLVRSHDGFFSWQRGCQGGHSGSKRDTVFIYLNGVVAYLSKLALSPLKRSLPSEVGSGFWYCQKARSFHPAGKASMLSPT